MGKTVTELQEFTECLVCGSKNAHVIVDNSELTSERKYLDHFWRKLYYPNTPDYLLKDHVFFSHDYDAQLVSCKNCGLVCRNPRWSPNQALRAFAQDEYHPEWLEAYYQPYRQAFLPEMPRLIRKLGKNAHVLEIGSYVGGFLAAAQENGWEAQSVDIGQTLSSFARSKGFNVFTGTLLDAHFPDSHFDAVFVWLCFEMLPNPQDDLREIHRILSNGGWLFISVPNGEFISLIHKLSKPRLFRDKIWKLLAYGILLGFPFQLAYTPASIKYLLSRSKFDSISVRDQFYVPLTSPEHVYPWVIREKERYLKLLHYFTQSIYQLSFHRMVIGPWMEICCRKKVNWWKSATSDSVSSRKIGS